MGDLEVEIDREKGAPCFENEKRFWKILVLYYVVENVYPVDPSAFVFCLNMEVVSPKG